MFYLLSTSGLSGVETASRIHSTGKSADHHLSRGGSGQLSPRSPSVADQRVKFQFENFNVECGNLRVQCPKSDVGSENLIKRQMLNVGCKQMNVHSTELEGRIRKLDCCLWKVECRKRKLECCMNQSWMLNAKNLNRACNSNDKH